MQCKMSDIKNTNVKLVTLQIKCSGLFSLNVWDEAALLDNWLKGIQRTIPPMRIVVRLCLYCIIIHILTGRFRNTEDAVEIGRNCSVGQLRRHSGEKFGSFREKKRMHWMYSVHWMHWMWIGINWCGKGQLRLTTRVNMPTRIHLIWGDIWKDTVQKNQ